MVGTHFAHVLRDRPDDSHGKGGLLQVGGLVADALWSHGFKVALLTLCLFVGGKQKKVIKITISTRRFTNGTSHHRHLLTIQ